MRRYSTVGALSSTALDEHIHDGIEGTLMPAFAKENGGSLSDEQIESLVKYLFETPLEPRTP